MACDFFTVARNLAMDGNLEGVSFLIRDRDTKFTRSFDEVFSTEGAQVIKSPVRSPKANAIAERFVRTIRHELLDQVIILGPRHLRPCSVSTRFTTTLIVLIAESSSAHPKRSVPTFRPFRSRRSTGLERSAA